MTGKAHPDDILVVGQMWEQSMWGEFDKRQIVHASNLDRQLRGRRIRHAYVSDLAWYGPMTPDSLFALDIARSISGGEIRDARDWRPEPEPSTAQRLWAGFLRLCERFG